MANAKDITTDSCHIHCIVYAPTGKGKTTLLGTFREAGPVFVADWDGGMLTLRGMDIQYTSYRPLIEKRLVKQVVKGKKAGETKEVVKEKVKKSAWQFFEEDLSRLEDGGVPANWEGDENPRTLGIDSMSIMQDYMVREAARQDGRAEPIWQDSGTIVNWHRKLWARLSVLPMHVVVCAHEQIIKDEVEGGLIIRPLIVGKKLPPMIGAYFDEVYRLAVEETPKGTRYFMRTKAGKNYDACSRLGLPSPMEPSYSAIMAAVRAKEQTDDSA